MGRIAAGQRCETGQTLVLLVLCVTALVGMAALVVDLGYFLLERRQLQTAADAAALAAAQELPGNNAAAAAHQWAANNGYDSAHGATVVVVTPYQGDASKVEVTIGENVPAFFA